MIRSLTQDELRMVVEMIKSDVERNGKALYWSQNATQVINALRAEGYRVQKATQTYYGQTVWQITKGAGR